MQINHTQYPKSLKSKTVSQLLYIIKDCREALEAMPESPKAGYYADEINVLQHGVVRKRNLG
jgi:hypothetical protein